VQFAALSREGAALAAREGARLAARAQEEASCERRAPTAVGRDADALACLQDLRLAFNDTGAHALAPVQGAGATNDAPVAKKLDLCADPPRSRR
jgi:hypothetical protein